MRFACLSSLLAAYFVIVFDSLQKLSFKYELVKHQIQTVIKILWTLWFGFYLLTSEFGLIFRIGLEELILSISTHCIFDFAIFLAVEVEFSGSFR